MPRRREVEKREILPDPQYHDRLVARCINSLMFDGKKSVAESIMYGTLDILAARTKVARTAALMCSKKRSTMRVRPSKSRAAAWVVPPIRFLWKSVPTAVPPSPSDGSSVMRANVRKNRWWSALRPNFSMPITTVVRQLRRRKTRTAWQKQTRLLRTTAGSPIHSVYP